MNELVTVKTAQNAGALAVAVSLLEDNGIECYLKGEIINQVYTALGGVQLQVPIELAEQAIKLLIEGGFATPEDYESDETIVKLSKIFDKISHLFKRK